MRFRPTFLGVFALILSCGPAPEGPADTVTVGPVTHAVAPSAEPSTGSEDIALGPEAALELVGFTGPRFAVIDTDEATVVFDAEASAAHRLAGHAVRTPYIGSDMWTEVNLTGNEPRSHLAASDDGRRLLLRTTEGIDAVDLAAHGATLAQFVGAARGASIAADGASFAAWTDTTMTIVRIADGARVTHSFTPAGDIEPELRWKEKTVSWADETGARVVELSTWRAQHIGIRGGTLVQSMDGGVAAAYRTADDAGAATVEVWRAGETKPAARAASAFAADLIIDAAGSKVAWLERAESDDAPVHVHTLDVATGAHARFLSKAKPCPIAPESLVAIENGELRTDGECNPGCPSISRQADYLAYDFASGRVLRHWMGDAEPPYTDELSVRSFLADQLAKRYGFDGKSTLPIVHHPSSDVVLVKRSEGLRIAEVVSGDDRAALQGSADFPASSAHFWPSSGVLVVGARPGAISVWDTASGKQVWAVGRSVGR